MKNETAFKIRSTGEGDFPWIRDVWMEHWGGDFVITRGRTCRFDEVAGFVAELNAEKAGLITYRIDGDELEITSINSFVGKKGVGSSLVEAVVDVGRKNSVRRVMLITTNDNLDALHFWQKRGFHLSAVYPGAMEVSRRSKPGIPLLGNDGIPIRDEIELDMAIR